MDIFKSFATDADAEVNGTWVPLSLVTGARLKIARSGNRKHAAVMQKLYRENRLALESDDIDESTAADERLTIEAVTEAILTDWDGPITYKDAPIAYSKENARMLLAHADFRALVVTHSRNFELYRAKMEAEAKNG